MAKDNVMGRKADANMSRGMFTTSDSTLDTSDNSSEKKEGMYRGSRNGRAGVNQVHEKGDTDNGNPGESMKRAGSIDTPTNTVQAQLMARARGGGLGSSRAKVGTKGNTTTPELNRP